MARADVPRDIDAEDAREHADADQAEIVAQLRSGHDLIRNDDGSLLLFGSRNGNRVANRCAVSFSDGDRVRLTQRERHGVRRPELLVGDREQDVSGPNAGPRGDTARMDVLEHPSQAIRRLRLHERGGEGDPSGRARTALVKTARVAGAELFEHASNRLLELLGGGTLNGVVARDRVGAFGYLVPDP